jgi:hypothetical protein
MRPIKSPGAVAAPWAGGKVSSETTRQKPSAKAPICAELIGSDRCEAEGLIVRGHAPVLQLCRALVAASFDPASPLEAWRGETLCLAVRSIGEGARLTVADDRHGTPRLRRRQEGLAGYVRGSPVAQISGGREMDAPAQQATCEAAP